MPEQPVKKGGLSGFDPAVIDFKKKAAQNKRVVLSAKQVRDRARARVKYDLPPQIKAAVEQAAALRGTSASQMAGWLLLYALLYCPTHAPRKPSHSPFFDWNLELPEDWMIDLAKRFPSGDTSGDTSGDVEE
jgi:hypothetical protein